MDERSCRTHGPDRWLTPSWRADAVGWIDARLTDAGIARTGEVVQTRVRPWGTVLRTETSDGVFWLKATSPATSFEASIYPHLAEVASDRVVRPLAVDTRRGWMLLPHGGVLFEDRLDGITVVEAMAEVLPRYAEMQRSLATSVGSFLELGVADWRPVSIPRHFDALLRDIADDARNSQHHVDIATLRKIASHRDTINKWAEELDVGPIPVSIDHNDLHLKSVLLPRSGDVDLLKFIDWGDCVVAHPFASLLMPLRETVRLTGIEPGDTALAKLRDSYLEVFDDLAPRRMLVRLSTLACNLGKVVRAWVFRRALLHQPQDKPHRYDAAPLHWLSMVLDDDWYGSPQF